MDINLFDYELPKELIAQTPLADRAASRLLALDKNTGDIKHGAFRDIGDYFNEGDCLVLNDTKVIPARLLGVLASGNPAEVLLLERLTDTEWEAIVKPGKKLREGAAIGFGDSLSATVKAVLPNGNRIISFKFDGVFEEILEQLGQTPLPPYITRKLDDKTRYNTIYAKYDGSAAAPTAGLHFTEDILGALAAKGVNIAYITLHVGLGTFRPVKEADAAKHAMHSERFIIGQEAAQTINAAKTAGGRVICAGTTSCRAIESAADGEGRLTPANTRTDIFIYPGYKFKITDGLITNFHLPKSTLIMLVAALAGRENTLSAYREAVGGRYRFFSFGDAMIVH